MRWSDVVQNIHTKKGYYMRVSFDITCPSGVTKEELEAYLKYELQIVCELPCANPLSSTDIGDLETRNLVVGCE